MTLLDATTTLIDTAKTYAPEDRVVARAVKRMEKRLRLLQLRNAKAIRRRRSSAWVDCLVVIKATCSGCGFVFDFGSFVKNAQLTGHGHIKSLRCPNCSKPLIGYPSEFEEL